MSSAAGVGEARAFAESVGRLLDDRIPSPGAWAPGQLSTPTDPALDALLDELGWSSLAREEGLTACAGLGAAELGRRLAPLHQLDRLLGASPAVGDLVRSLGTDRAALIRDGKVVLRRRVVRSEPVASADGLDVHRMLDIGEPSHLDPVSWRVAVGAWTAASVGYLAGLGQAALEMTVAYVASRRAFGTTLAALAPVQQLLAAATTAVRGVELLAVAGPDGDALAHAGPAITGACAACQQVTGAIGFTLEYPLQRYTQRARALATWNDALLEWLT